jgi:hypothetical protein
MLQEDYETKALLIRLRSIQSEYKAALPIITLVQLSPSKPPFLHPLTYSVYLLV